jgi:hypothetical protein
MAEVDPNRNPSDYVLHGENDEIFAVHWRKAATEDVTTIENFDGTSRTTSLTRIEARGLADRSFGQQQTATVDPEGLWLRWERRPR